MNAYAAMLTVHSGHGLFATNNGIELPLLYATAALGLAMAGFGPYSLDAWLSDRNIGRVVTTAPPALGFIGEGHTAVTVVDPKEFVHNDPFIALMDDRIDLAPGR